LEEFDNSRQVVEDLIAEYTAAERPDYLNWSYSNVSEQNK